MAVAWSPEIEKLVLPDSLVFICVHPDGRTPLFSEPLLTERVHIWNDMSPAALGRPLRTPPGHPPLRSLMAMPVFFGGRCVGTLQIANRPGGYTDAMAQALRGACDACGLMLHLCHEAPLPAPAGAAEPELDLYAPELATCVIRSIRDAVLVTDSSLVVRLANEGALRLLGYERAEQLRGQDVRRILSPFVTEGLDWTRLAAEWRTQQSLPKLRGEADARDARGNDVPISFSMSSFLFQQVSPPSSSSPVYYLAFFDPQRSVAFSALY